MRRTAGDDDGLAIGGSSFAGFLDVMVLISMGKEIEAHDEIDLYMDPLGTKSVEAAIDADVTWGSNVDDGRLLSIDNVRRFTEYDRPVVAADFHCRFIKQVLT